MTTFISILITFGFAVYFNGLIRIGDLELKVNVWGAMISSWLMSHCLGLTLLCIGYFLNGEAVSWSDVSISFWQYIALSLFYFVTFYILFAWGKKAALEKKKKEAEAAK
jgi:hypothetical protein